METLSCHPSPLPFSGRRCAVLGGLLLALLGGPLTAREPQSAPVTSREQQLEQLRDRIAVLKSKLNEVRRREQGIEGELERTELELQLEGTRLAEATAARDLAASQLAATESEIARLESQLARIRQRLKGSLVRLYRLGGEGYLRLLLSIDSTEDLLPAIRDLRFMAQRDADALARFHRLRGDLDFQRNEQAEERRRLDGWVLQEQQRRRTLERLRRRERGLLAEVRRRGEGLASEAGLLQDKEERLSSLLDTLYGRSGRPLTGTPIDRFKGVLDWPVAGRIAAGFGPRRDARYKTLVPHNGIDIATHPGDLVRAVYPGKVLFAAPLEGYGETVVLLHPDRVFTLYAGLSKLRARPDAMVSLGDVVGTAGSSLYFEIRVDNRPQDPTSWLR